MDTHARWTNLKVKCPHSGNRAFDVPFRYGLHEGERWPLDIVQCDNSCNDEVCRQCPNALFSKLLGKDAPEISTYEIVR